MVFSTSLHQMVRRKKPLQKETEPQIPSPMEKGTYPAGGDCGTGGDCGADGNCGAGGCALAKVPSPAALLLRRLGERSAPASRCHPGVLGVKLLIGNDLLAAGSTETGAADAELRAAAGAPVLARRLAHG